MTVRNFSVSCVLFTCFFMFFLTNSMTSYAGSTSGLIAVESIQDSDQNQASSDNWDLQEFKTSYSKGYKHNPGTLGHLLECMKAYAEGTNGEWHKEPIVETIKNINTMVKLPSQPEDSNGSSHQATNGTQASAPHNLSGITLTQTDLEGLSDEEIDIVIETLKEQNPEKYQSLEASKDLSGTTLTKTDLEGLSEKEVEAVLIALKEHSTGQQKESSDGADSDMNSGSVDNAGGNSLMISAEDADLSDLAAVDPMSFAKPFTELDNTVNKELKDIFASAYHTLAHVAIAGLVFSFISGGVCLMALTLNHRPGAKEEIMTMFGSKIIVFMMFCSIVIIVDVLSTIITSITGS